MKYRSQRWVLALACAAMVGFAADEASSSIHLGGGLGTILKVGGIVVAVRMFGSEIDKTINTLLAQRGLSYEGATKVVPIVSVGRGAFVGASQVQGARSFVDQVRAVGEVEAKLGDLQGRYLIPLNSTTPGKGSIHGVEGVGVSAMIDFRI